MAFKLVLLFTLCAEFWTDPRKTSEDIISAVIYAKDNVSGSLFTDRQDETGRKSKDEPPLRI